MKKYIFTLITSLVATVAIAQITPQQERAFYQKAYAVMSDYSNSANVRNARNEDKFKSLFATTDMQIANDLMSLSSEATLSVTEYARILRSASSVNVRVKNIRKGQISDEGETLQMPVTLEKELSYIDNCGTYFDSHEFFGRYGRKFENTDYKLTAIVVMDKRDGRTYIGALSMASDSPTFPQNYTVLEKKDARDEKLTVDDRIVTFNQYDQILLYPGYKIKYLGADVGETVSNEEGCGRKIAVHYADKNFRVRPNFAFSLGGLDHLSGADDVETSGSEMSFGVDFGYVFPSNGRLQTGVFVGVGVSKHSLTMDYMPDAILDNDGMTNYHNEMIVPAGQTDENASYTRRYLLSSGIHQKLSATSIAVPIYADFEYRFAPTLSAYADLGVKLLTNGGSFTNEVDAYETWGVYPQYDNLVIRPAQDGSGVTINEFGNHGKYTKDALDDDISSSMNFFGLVGLGLRFNIGKSFAVDAGIQYQHGFGNGWSSDVKDNSKNNIATYTKANGDQFYNLIRRSDGIKQHAFKIGVSLIYKF